MITKLGTRTLKIVLVAWSLFTVFLCELLCVLHELFPVLCVFLRQLCSQWMLRFRVVDEGNEGIDH